MLPTSISSIETYYCENDEEREYEDEDECGLYTYNLYEALKSADDCTYRYTSVENRATNVLDVLTAPYSKKLSLKDLFLRHSQHHHKAHK